MPFQAGHRQAASLQTKGWGQRGIVQGPPGWAQLQGEGPHVAASPLESPSAGAERTPDPNADMVGW